MARTLVAVRELDRVAAGSLVRVGRHGDSCGRGAAADGGHGRGPGGQAVNEIALSLHNYNFAALARRVLALMISMPI